jgi:hypothetical protein
MKHGLYGHLPYKLLHERIKRVGMSFEEAITMPYNPVKKIIK